MVAKKTIMVVGTLLFLCSSCAFKVSVTKSQECSKIRMSDYIGLMNDAALLAEYFAEDINIKYRDIIVDSYCLNSTFVNFIAQGNRLIFHYDSLYYDDNGFTNLTLKPAIFCDFKEEIPQDFEQYIIYSKLDFNSSGTYNNIVATYHLKKCNDSAKVFINEEILQVESQTDELNTL